MKPSPFCQLELFKGGDLRRWGVVSLPPCSPPLFLTLGSGAFWVKEVGGSRGQRDRKDGLYALGPSGSLKLITFYKAFL